METKQLTKSAILGALLIILSFVCIGTGIGATLYVELIVPIAIVMIYIECGLKWTVLASIDVLCIVALALGRPTTSLMMLQSILLGLIVGKVLQRKSEVMDDLLIASLGGCLVMLVMDYFLTLLTGISLLDDTLGILGILGDRELEQSIYYLSIASVPIGSIVIVYVGSLLILRRLGGLKLITRDKYKIIKGFFKYRPYIYCSRKVLVFGTGYSMMISCIPLVEIPYIKALMITTQYIMLYFIASDCWAILNQWCYAKTRSAFISSGLMLLVLIGCINYFKWFLYGIVVIGILIDSKSKIRKEQYEKLSYILKYS